MLQVRINSEFYIGLLIGLFILFVFVLPIFLPLNEIDIFASIFNKMSIGVASFLAVLKGSDYLKKKEEESLIKYYQKKYPRDDEGKGWKIIMSEKMPGTWYLLDMHQLQKHHIGNMKTVYDLNFQSAKHNILTDDDFLSYIEGERIMTRGVVGD